MKTFTRRFGWLVVSAMSVALAVVSLRAADTRPWATEQALGDVAVSFDGTVRIFRNADAVQVGDLPLLGTTIGGLAFDNELNLLVADTSNDQIVKLGWNSPHAPVSPVISTQDAPRSLTLAGDGTIYVASAGYPLATIWRIVPGASSVEFTVPTDSTACIGVDLAPDQSTLYYVSGGRTVRTVSGANTASGTATATTLSPTLQNTGPGVACGIRLLAPIDSRSTSPRVATSMIGGMLIADERSIKQLDSANAVVWQSTSDVQNNWVDVALDPNTFDFWAVDAGSVWRLARYRLGGSNQLLLNLGGTVAPRGVAVNGELRAAQTIRLLNISSDCTTNSTPGCWVESPVSPSFLAGTPSLHDFAIRPEPDFGTSASAFLAVQAVEARSDGNKLVSPDGNGICPAPPSGSLPLDGALDVDCRLDSFLPSAKARSYSHVVPGVAGTGRPVFYMVTELQAAVLDPEVPLRIRVVAFGTSPGPGAACVPNGPTQTAAALLWDPYPHVVAGTVGYSIFEKDITFLVYSDETGKVGRTLSHFVAVDRSDTRYSALLVKPVSGTSQNIGSTMQVAVEIRDPKNGCSPVANLSGVLALSITDLTTKKLLVDSEGVSGGPTTSGLTFVSTASQYRANVTVTSPPFTSGNKVRVCVNAKASAVVSDPPEPRAIGEVCTVIPDVLIAGKAKK